MSNKSDGVRIGIPLYPKFDSLDVLGAYQVFFLTKGIEPFLIGSDTVISAEGVEFRPHISFEEYASSSEKKMDILFVPGSSIETALDVLENNDEYIEFLKYVSEEIKALPIVSWPRLTSVCAGAILLATTGVFDGHSVTTHWAMRGALSNLKGVTLAAGYPRYVHDGNILTGGGISSTIDEALYLTGLITSFNDASRTELLMQYNPQPPYSGGDPATAPREFVDPILERSSKPAAAIRNILRSTYGA